MGGCTSLRTCGTPEAWAGSVAVGLVLGATRRGSARRSGGTTCAPGVGGLNNTANANGTVCRCHLHDLQ